MLIVLKSNDEHLRASSSASIQHFPAALFGALKIRCEVGRGWTTAPIVSPSGPRAALQKNNKSNLNYGRNTDNRPLITTFSKNSGPLFTDESTF